MLTCQVDPGADFCSRPQTMSKARKALEKTVYDRQGFVLRIQFCSPYCPGVPCKNLIRNKDLLVLRKMDD